MNNYEEVWIIPLLPKSFPFQPQTFLSSPSLSYKMIFLYLLGDDNDVDDVEWLSGEEKKGIERDCLDFQRR